MCVTIFTYDDLLDNFRERLMAVHKNPSKLNFKLYWDAVKLLNEYKTKRV